MMSFIWRSRKTTTAYDSLRWLDSQVLPRVSFRVRKVSLENKLQLVQRIRELSLKHEFLRTGDISEQSEASIGDLLVKKLYLEWGLVAIRGLTIDGKPATAETLIQNGPEELAEEVIAQIRRELGLSEQERKNY